MGRLFCKLGLHKVYKARWVYDRFTGRTDWMIVRCHRPMCGWGRRING